MHAKLTTPSITSALARLMHPRVRRLALVVLMGGAACLGCAPSRTLPELAQHQARQVAAAQTVWSPDIRVTGRLSDGLLAFTALPQMTGKLLVIGPDKLWLKASVSDVVDVVELARSEHGQWLLLRSVEPGAGDVLYLQPNKPGPALLSTGPTDNSQSRPPSDQPERMPVSSQDILDALGLTLIDLSPAHPPREPLPGDPSTAKPVPTPVVSADLCHDIVTIHSAHRGFFGEPLPARRLFFHRPSGELRRVERFDHTGRRVARADLSDYADIGLEPVPNVADDPDLQALLGMAPASEDGPMSDDAPLSEDRTAAPKKGGADPASGHTSAQASAPRTLRLPRRVRIRTGRMLEQQLDVRIEFGRLYQSKRQPVDDRLFEPPGLRDSMRVIPVP